MRDIDGNEVDVGDVVKVLTIDAEFLQFLSDEDKSLHLSMIGNDYVVDEIVENGLKASVSIVWKIEDTLAFGGLYMRGDEFRLVTKSS